MEGVKWCFLTSPLKKNINQIAYGPFTQYNNWIGKFSLLILPKIAHPNFIIKKDEYIHPLLLLIKNLLICLHQNNNWTGRKSLLILFSQKSLPGFDYKKKDGKPKSLFLI